MAQTKKISAGQMWKSEQTGEVFVVTSLYNDVLTSFAILRRSTPPTSDVSKRAKIVKTAHGESLVGFTMAELV
jgi:hypothetical protein